MFRDAYDTDNKESFRHRYKEMTSSTLEKQNVVVYPGQFVKKDSYLNDSIKEKGEFCFFESELTDKPFCCNTMTRELRLNADGDKIIQWFIDVFPSLHALSLKSRNINLKLLEQLNELTSLSLSVGMKDLSVLHLPRLQRFALFYQMPRNANTNDAYSLKQFFNRNQSITYLRIFFSGGGSILDQTHRNEVIECSMTSLKNLTELVIESDGNIANVASIQAIVKLHANDGFTMKFTAEEMDITMVKDKQNEEVEVSKSPMKYQRINKF